MNKTFIYNSNLKIIRNFSTPTLGQSRRPSPHTPLVDTLFHALQTPLYRLPKDTSKKSDFTYSEVTIKFHEV